VEDLIRLLFYFSLYSLHALVWSRLLNGVPFHRWFGIMWLFAYMYTIALFAVLYLWERGRTPASQFLFTRILAILVVVLHIYFLCQYIQVCTSSRIDVHFASLINHPRSTVQFKNRYSKGCCHLRGHIHCAHNVFRNSPSRIFFLTDPFEFGGRLGLLLFSIQRSQ